MMKLRCIAMFAAMALTLSALAAEPAKKVENRLKADELKTELDKVSYAIGAQIGRQLRSMNVDVSLNILSGAISDAFTSQTLLMTDDEMMSTVRSFRMKQRDREEASRKESSDKALAEGKAFLEANAKKEGVKSLPSGLQYKVLHEGKGKTPKAASRVKAHYKGTLINGTEFDSSYKRNEPFETGVGDVIKGWTEALQLMKEGDKWQLFIPPQLAYGESGAGPQIPGNSVLIFEMELLEVLPEGAAK